MVEAIDGDLPVVFQEVRVYASVNVKSENEQKLRGWLDSHLRSMPGFTVSIAERTSRSKPVFCTACNDKVSVCPQCGAPLRRAIEKGVDSAIITDMFALHIEKVYDIAMLASSDADMLPMVRYLQSRGVKIVNLWADPQPTELRKTCWSFLELAALTPQLQL